MSSAALVGTLVWSFGAPVESEWGPGSWTGHGQHMMAPMAPGGMGVLIAGPGQIQNIGEATSRAERLAAQWDLHVGEVMEFSNHFYVELVERDGGGATEVIVDRETGDVQVEWGPAMMWNTAYGMMPVHTRADRPNIDEERARALADEWLEKSRPELRTGELHSFPGYYTLHTERDGHTVGMLSVHGRTGAVWYHTWHGEFIQSLGHSE
ncbi:hypothetical protein [Hoyosella altamirensis]|uniref:PepSY domain-containing protein n=1 Tax=Hoyosella altamirensis TaxID=616997 RepID=A0A839RJY0_9ACTN|nr:hypothetical protein [Hoyosella altamirensis]MBB3037142.1 hypothetical protein [Hoyosella altamirensis]